ncbi:MAG: hypothetical protein IKO01_07810 [Kiritimatiellae bacterium]|nr:hypothetical protein [Kiritimatiellia bacterium]
MTHSPQKQNASNRLHSRAIDSRPLPLRSLRQPLCVLCVFPLRRPCASPAPKIFSNHWKTAEKFFQSLEKSARFSNHWKKVFQSLEKSAEIFQPLETFFPIIGKLFPRPQGAHRIFSLSTFHFSLLK